jgi:hypothetical protein
LPIVLAISLAAQGSDAPTADGADSSTTAVAPPTAVAVSTPSSRRRNVAVLPVREVIQNSLLACGRVPRGHPAIDSGGSANSADKKMLTFDQPRRRGAVNADIVAELLQLSEP